MRGTRYKIILLFIFCSHFFFGQNTCTCNENQLLFSENYIKAHSLIFRGKTLSVEKGTDYGKAVFSITQLFKGSASKEITVYFDQKSECNLKLNAGEDWIIYANYRQLQKPFVEYCSRSRKNVVNTNKNVEVQYIKSDLTVDAESDRLVEQLGSQKFAAQADEDNRHSNIIPGFNQRVILILLSIAGFVLIYFLLNKFLLKK